MGTISPALQTKVIPALLFSVILILGLISWKHTAVWKNTITLFERETLLNPTNETPLIQLGHAYFIDKDYAAARDNLNRAIEVKPDGFYGYAYLGFVEESQGNHNEAEHLYLLAIERNELLKYHHVVDVYEHLVWVSSMLKKHEQALGHLKQGLVYFPESAYLQELKAYYEEYYPRLSESLR